MSYMTSMTSYFPYNFLICNTILQKYTEVQSQATHGCLPWCIS